ncbi:VOC family protein [Ligilactobacillus saerimneri]|uniref:SMU1112c/YaeR family gloxylase I-like metalloprotein n=1 Tax=Ligilactobacillus saerimneri TaxID=228229 RepID=UPI0004225D93|nr:VOC family protein [Ligilactobacillus saerimneri]KRL73866.1 hypothetical protein FC54_GL000371 [Ligilactobacillus saerimneri DSM 16049]
MQLETIHHIALIGHDYQQMYDFYVNKLGFKVISQHERPAKEDTILNVQQGALTLEIFIKPAAPARPSLPQPETQGLRHLAFKVASVTTTLHQFDQLGIPHETLRYDDFTHQPMAFFFDPSGQPLEIHE